MMPQEFVLHSPVKLGNVDVSSFHPHFDIGPFGSKQKSSVAQHGDSKPDTALSEEELKTQPLLILLGDMLHGTDLFQSMHSAATWIRKEVDASFVLLGASVDGMNVRHSVQSGLSARMELVDLRDAIHAGLQETILAGRKHLGHIGQPAGTAKRDDCGRSVRHLGEQLPGCQTILAFPLITSQGRTVGSIVVGWPSAFQLAQPKGVEPLEYWTTAMADVFQLLLKPPSQFPSSIMRTLRRRISQNQLISICLFLGFLTIIGLIPTPYPIRARVVAEPDSRRWIAAPFDAPLKKSNVVPGQKVMVGDLLYSVDCQDLLNKLASLKADADKYAAERVTHLSAARLADAAIAGASLKRTQIEIDLIHRYLDRAEVRSPVDGVVMGQDLQRLEGSPLKQGQTLLEIAPLDSLHLKAEIPTDQISEVVIGNEAVVSMESIGDLGSSTLVRFQPRAESNEQGHYAFEGRIDLREQVPGLMPGMSGFATLKGTSKPLAWCLFQRLWQRVRTWSEEL